MQRVNRHFEIVLISTYELGRQPFGLASPAAWLRNLGATVDCLDLSLEQLNAEQLRTADLVAFYLPMHTATRIAMRAIRLARQTNPAAHLCAYGLYATVNAGYLRREGIETFLGGEFEAGLCRLALELSGVESPAAEPVRAASFVSLGRQAFVVPDRSGLPPLGKYARLALPDGSLRVAGYTEASRGCKHLCRHCPVVPVYNGAFRVVQPEIVLADIRQQVARGAQHITFGDPDFFNGIGHAIEVVESLHREFPSVTYDVTIKIEHLKRHAARLPALRQTGCLFVTSAVESVDDRVLEILDKGHTRADFIEVAGVCREIGLHLAPTFVAFTPWLTLDGYRDLLATVAELGLAANVAPVQWAIRLLVPAGSRLLEREETRLVLGEFDEAALSYRWTHPDARVDALQKNVERLVKLAAASGESRGRIFRRIWEMAEAGPNGCYEPPPMAARATIPYLTEPWYC